ncbi:MAG: hypothetical protein EXQ74_05905 [Thermoleophilia bacterium]|nr:hypothetical protein [Thermoleophilia bacterium]
MDGVFEIVVRNSQGIVVGHVSRDADGQIVTRVLDEDSRWLVELTALRAAAPPRPRPRPSCAPPSDGGTGPFAAT